VEGEDDIPQVGIGAMAERACSGRVGAACVLTGKMTSTKLSIITTLRYRPTLAFIFGALLNGIEINPVCI
jgi:hypothetical protein